MSRGDSLTVMSLLMILFMAVCMYICILSVPEGEILPEAPPPAPSEEIDNHVELRYKLQY